MRGKQTPPEVVCAIRELLQLGHKAQEIIKIIKERLNCEISASPVHKERYAMGLPANRTGRPRGSESSKFKADVYRLTEQEKKTPTEIARLLGISRQTVYDCLKAWRREEKKL
jgi:hypothetical protein